MQQRGGALWSFLPGDFLEEGREPHLPEVLDEVVGL